MRKIKTHFMMFVVALVISLQNLMAMARPNQDPNAPPPPAWMQFLPFIVMIGVFYLLLIRPQSRQKGERQKMLDSLKKGDKVVTQGGLIGTITNINPQTAEIKLNEETKVKILKSAINEIWNDAAESKDQPAVVS